MISGRAGAAMLPEPRWGFPPPRAHVAQRATPALPVAVFNPDALPRNTATVHRSEGCSGDRGSAQDARVVPVCAPVTVVRDFWICRDFQVLYFNQLNQDLSGARDQRAVLTHPLC